MTHKFFIKLAVFVFGLWLALQVKISLAAEGDLLWMKNSNVNTKNEAAFDVAADENNVYTAGYYSAMNYQARWRVERRTQGGAIVWSINYVPTGSFTAPDEVAVDSSGLYVVGYESSLTGWMWRIEKRDLSNGQIIWAENSNYTNMGTFPNQATAVSIDGSYLYIVGLIGGSRYYDGMGWYSDALISIEKRRKDNGSLIWSRVSNPYPGLDRGSDQANDIAVDSTGVYWVGSAAVPSLYYAMGAQWLIEKWDLDGNFVWAKNINFSEAPEEANAVAIHNGFLYVAGDSKAVCEWQIEKRDSGSGGLIWSKSFHPGTSCDLATDIAVNSGGIYTVGIDSSLWWNNLQWGIEKRDLDGNVKWYKTSGGLKLGDWSDPLAFWGPKIALSSSGMYLVGADRLLGNSQWRIEKREVAPTCVDNVWLPDPATVCSDESFTQTSNCGNTRTVSGTKTDSVWSPDPSTICAGQSFQQTGDCGGTRTAVGTKNCNQAPVAVATISKDDSSYVDSIIVTRGVATAVYLSANHSNDGLVHSGSYDPDSWGNPANGVSVGGKCEWNSDLNQGAPTFEQTINNPISPSSCNIFLGNLIFNDAPGVYTYQVLKITDRQGAVSDIDTVSVTVQAPLNQSPSADNLEKFDEKYCTDSPEEGQIFFRWTYNDDDGDSESRFDFRVNDVNNVSDPNYEIDRSFEGLNNPSGSTNNQPALVSSSSSSDKLTYNKTYYWWVRVYDSKGVDSGWIFGPSFTAPKHAYPSIDFSWAPLNPTVNENTQFTDQSSVYGGATKSFWSWAFQDGSPATSALQNPLAKFLSTGSKSVALRVTDSDGFACTGQKTINVQLSLPEWIEIPPF